MEKDKKKYKDDKGGKDKQISITKFIQAFNNLTLIIT
jgi:hypothetical protein